jgi:hypothetical protein
MVVIGLNLAYAIALATTQSGAPPKHQMIYFSAATIIPLISIMGLVAGWALLRVRRVIFGVVALTGWAWYSAIVLGSIKFLWTP